jgi:RimJ/RimL family protein N-acetyltransferase
VTLELRPATHSDEALLLAWRNDPATRASAFSQHEVTPSEHRIWFDRKLADPASVILIAELEGKAVGQVRLERVEESDVAEVDISIDPTMRGRGIAREALRLVARQAEGLLSVKQLRAHVKPDNGSSLKAFRAAGFAVVGEDERSFVLTRSTTEEPDGGYSSA